MSDFTKVTPTAQRCSKCHHANVGAWQTHVQQQATQRNCWKPHIAAASSKEPSDGRQPLCCIGRQCWGRQEVEAGAAGAAAFPGGGVRGAGEAIAGGSAGEIAEYASQLVRYLVNS